MKTALKREDIEATDLNDALDLAKVMIESEGLYALEMFGRYIDCHFAQIAYYDPEHEALARMTQLKEEVKKLIIKTKFVEGVLK